MSTIWQVGGGVAGATYEKLLVKYGLALIGPGDPGEWTRDRKDVDFGGSWVRRFATEPKIGDVVLLRIGADRVIAVGIVASDYQYLDQFDDVHGWGLQHARRVRWRVLASPQVFSSRVFGANPPRFSRANTNEVVHFANAAMAIGLEAWQNATLPSLPPPEPAWKAPPQWLNAIVGLAQDWERMMGPNYDFGGFPSEDDMLVHFVVPLFRSMGWPQELLAVKWNRVDLAVFRCLPRVTTNCCFVVEAKKPGIVAESALKQAINYSKELQSGADVLLTDGFRYRLYDAAADFLPVAYANLLTLKANAANLYERLSYRPVTNTKPAQEDN